MGDTWSSNFLATSGAYDTSYNGKVDDVFVSKLDSGLTSLLASTFLGGTMPAAPYFLALDADGNVTVVGNTNSPDFPVTSGSYSTSFNLGADVGADVFISKLDGNLSANAACAAKSITVAFNKLTLKGNVDTTIVVTVLGDGNCPAEDVTVTATIKGKGNRFVTVAPDSRKTGTGGQTLFFITPNGKKGTALIKFKASGVNKVATLRVTVK